MSIYFLRLLFTLFVFFQRKMYWGEAIVIANIMPWIFPYIAYQSENYSGSIGWIEIVGILLFLTGSFLNTAAMPPIQKGLFPLFFKAWRGE